MNTPKFKIGDRVKWIADDGRELSGVVVAATKFGQVSVRENADDRFVSWWHESHLSLDVPLASKFKIGNRVKWRDYEGRQRKGVIISAQLSSHTEPVSFYVKEVQELLAGRWHESHLSLDVPEPKKHATDLEARLGAEITKQHKAIIDLSNRLAEAKAAQRSVNEAYVEAVGKWHEAQKRNSKLSTKLADITRIVGTP